MGSFCPDPTTPSELRWRDHQGDGEKTQKHTRAGERGGERLLIKSPEVIERSGVTGLHKEGQFSAGMCW